MILLFALSVATSVQASPLFDDDTVLEVRLAGPLSSVMESAAERRKFPFTLTLGDLEHRIEVRARGNSRLRVCRFPPLRLDFDGQAPPASEFVGQKALKLVTHCLDKEAGNDNVLEEYAAYRIFNLLSEFGFRVRLLHLTYIDTEHNRSLSRYGFLIESMKEFAARVGGQRVRRSGVRLGELNAGQAALVYVYQFLIGNTDWSLVAAEGDDHCCHNVDLVDVDGGLYPIPYDFDLAGLVNASYARPDPSLRIPRVTRRLYRGYCIDTAALEMAVLAIDSKKEAILSILSRLPSLEDRALRRDRRYLDKYFETADDRQRMIRSFERRCL